MSPEGENEAQFILRVEDFRLRYSQAEETCYRTFIPKLSLEYREGLHQWCRARGLEEVEWSHVVKEARN